MAVAVESAGEAAIFGAYKYTYRRSVGVDVGCHAEGLSAEALAGSYLQCEGLPVSRGANQIGVIGCARPLPCPNSLRQHEQSGNHNGR